MTRILPMKFGFVFATAALFVACGTKEKIKQKIEDKSSSSTPSPSADPAPTPVADPASAPALANGGVAAAPVGPVAAPQPAPEVFRVAIFGDSVAAGFLADTNQGETLSASKMSELLDVLNDAALKNLPPNEIQAKTAKKLAYSNFTAFGGNQSYSHPKRLEALLGRTVTVENFAVSGDMTNTMKKQTELMSKKYSEGAAKPADYIAVHIGANDFCDKRALDTVRSDLTERLSEIASANPKANILVLAVPNVPGFMTTADSTAFKTPLISFACSQLKESFKTCKSRNFKPNEAAAEIAPDLADVQALNKMYSEVVDKSKTVAGFQGKITLGNYQLEPKPELLAIDCFHPGQKGHEGLANSSWPFVEKMFKP